MGIGALLRASSDAESAFLEVHSDVDVPGHIARPPRAAVLTMRDVRAVHAGGSVVVVEPQEYLRTATLTRRSRALLLDFYPRGRHRPNARTGLSTGSGPACTGSGCDEWWVSNAALASWLDARTRWFGGAIRSLVK